MLLRLPMFLAALAFVFAATGCSSLTRPDEIQIYAEPPAPKVVAPTPAPAQAGARPGAQAAPPGGGG